jgi:protein TonB
VWRGHDPTGQRFGVKNRLTVLRVTLDPEGALKHLHVAKQSGLDFLDDEARRAFSAASPFPNPPSGLRNGQGEIEFQFGFLFEISTQRFRMRGWQ